MKGFAVQFYELILFINCETISFTVTTVLLEGFIYRCKFNAYQYTINLMQKPWLRTNMLLNCAYKQFTQFCSIRQFSLYFLFVLWYDQDLRVAQTCHMGICTIGPVLSHTKTTHPTENIAPLTKEKMETMIHKSIFAQIQQLFNQLNEHIKTTLLAHFVPQLQYTLGQMSQSLLDKQRTPPPLPSTSVHLC